MSLPLGDVFAYASDVRDRHRTAESTGDECMRTAQQIGEVHRRVQRCAPVLAGLRASGGMRRNAVYAVPYISVVVVFEI